MRDPRTSRALLVVAALSSFAIALAHLGIMVMGAPGYRWFGASGLAVQVEGGSSVPALRCIGVAAILGIWGLYALSGAGRIRPMPMLRVGILLIGTIYGLRGLLGVPQLMWVLAGRNEAPLRYLLFSLVSGVTGVLYLAGLFTLSGATRAISEEGHPTA
jgi:hypothetical protein